MFPMDMPVGPVSTGRKRALPGAGLDSWRCLESRKQGSGSRAGLVESRRGGGISELSAQPARHFSGSVEDCKSALRWLRPCPTYHLDTDRFLAWGARQAAIWSPYSA